MTAPLHDAEARRQIREELGATFVVEAAAGTGKTTELVARIVALVQSGRARLDRVLALTFTDLAAGEMKLRLRAELERAGEGAPEAERARLLEALGQLELAAIGTIHSFCADLLRERPVEARVDPRFEVAAGDAQERLYGQAFDDWFGRMLEAPPPGVARLLRRRARRPEDAPRERLRAAGRELREHRDFPGPWSRPPLDRAAVLADAVAAVEEIAVLAPRAQNPADKLAQGVAELARWLAELRLREEARGRDLDALEADLHELCGRWLPWNAWGSGRWFGPGLERLAVRATRDAAKARIDAALRACDEDLAAALHEELKPLCAAYEELKSRAGCLDFFDLLLRVRELLGEGTAVRAELQARYSHVLVDEFQDTDPLQAGILLLLCADDPACDDPQRARPSPGKLFVVGDPKQSIYRFRRADLALYADVKERLLAAGARLLHLTTSFRSVPGIQAAINAAFAPAMQGGAQASYVALQPFRDQVVGQPAVIALPAPRMLGASGKITKERVQESYADAVGGFVEWLIGESGWTVQERDGRSRVPVEARHVCLVLKRLRNFRDDVARPYLRALEARRVPHALVGGRSFHDREEVAALRAVLHAIEWPDDELSVFAALRGPFLALGDDALLVFRERHGRLHPLRRFDGAPPEGLAAQVADALSLLGDLHLRRNLRPLAQTVSAFLDATRAHAGLAIGVGGEQALANVLRLVESARRFESGGGGSFRAFVDHLDAESSRAEAAEAPVIEEGSDGVRIMSVHKAKGLEFPVVILCDPMAPPLPRTPSRHLDPARQLWAFPLAGCVPHDLRAHEAEALERDREETVRVAYVAATRARDLLVVPLQGNGEAPAWLAPLGPATSPRPEARRVRTPAPGCPAFTSSETVLDLPADGTTSIAPGLHQPQAGDHSVVVWDPLALRLDVQPGGGLRSLELLVEDESSRPAARAVAEAHDDWQRARRAVLATAAAPSVRVESATSLAAAGGGGDEGHGILHEAVAGRAEDRPRGRRFGTLVHAVLADVPLEADEALLARSAAAQGRLVDATPEEVAAAVEAARAALAHPRMRAAAAAREVRRETSILRVLPDGGLLEGVVDLAYLDDAGWTVIDFKTDARAEDVPAYGAQLRLYCGALAAASGLPARGVLLSV